MVLHADRGTQFTSHQLHDAVAVAVAASVRMSMSKTGVYWVNATAESFWGDPESRVLRPTYLRHQGQQSRTAYVNGSRSSTIAIADTQTSGPSAP